jgi:hypothetical protein
MEGMFGDSGIEVIPEWFDEELVNDDDDDDDEDDDEW